MRLSDMSYKNYLDKVLNEDVNTRDYTNTKGYVPPLPTNVKDYVKQLDDDIKAIFPKSKVTVRLEKSLSGKNDNDIFIRFTLGTEYTNNIWQNDPCWSHMFIWNPADENNDVRNKISVESNSAGVIHDKDNGRIRVPWSKKTGTPGQVKNHILKYFIKVRETLIANRDKMDDIVKDKF
jgi:hypothetical protein